MFSRKIVNLNLKSKEVVVIISNGAVNWFFDKSLGKNAKKVFQKIFSASNFMKNIEAKEKEISKKLLLEITTPVNELFTNKTLNEKGKKKLQKIYQYYSDYGQLIDGPGFLFQVYMTEELKKEIFNKLHKTEDEKNEIFNFVISSYKKTNYERFLFALSENMGDKEGLKQAADNFYWVVHDYLGDIIDLKYVENKIQEFEKSKDLNAYLEGTVERIEKIKRIRKELPKDLLEKVSLIQEMLHLYNERIKEVLNQVNIYLRRIMEYKFPGYSVSKIRELYQLAPDEIVNLLKGEKIKDIEKRNQLWGYYIKDEVISLAPEGYFKLISAEKDIKILKGIPASPGVVKGRINIILNISHIYKFREGDILVAPFTNVNYLPIMSKSKAILTETGGVTSHAAVVSREFKKPCVVGIKNLLLVLRDGDLVEIDADRGIIKKIK